MLDGPSKELIGHEHARKTAHATNDPQSGAMHQPATNALDDRKSDAGRLSPDLSTRRPDSAPLFETAKTFQVRRRGAENNPTPQRSPIPFRRTPERAETAKFVQPFERDAERDLILLSVRLTTAFQPRRLMMAPAADGCKRVMLIQPSPCAYWQPVG